MQFIGTLAIDQGGMNLNSFRTREMSFSEAGDWYNQAVEYVRNTVRVTPSIIEARVSIYDASQIHSLTVEPIEFAEFHQG